MRCQPHQRVHRDIPGNPVGDNDSKDEVGDPGFPGPFGADDEGGQERDRQDHQGIHGQGTGEVAVEKTMEGAERSAAGTIEAGCPVERARHKQSAFSGILEKHRDSAGNGDQTDQNPVFQIMGPVALHIAHFGGDTQHHQQEVRETEDETGGEGYPAEHFGFSG